MGLPGNHKPTSAMARWGWERAFLFRDGPRLIILVFSSGCEDKHIPVSKAKYIFCFIHNRPPAIKLNPYPSGSKTWANFIRTDPVPFRRFPGRRGRHPCAIWVHREATPSPQFWASGGVFIECANCLHPQSPHYACPPAPVPTVSRTPPWARVSLCDVNA